MALRNEPPRDFYSGSGGGPLQGPCNGPFHDNLPPFLLLSEALESSRTYNDNDVKIVGQ